MRDEKLLEPLMQKVQGSKNLECCNKLAPYHLLNCRLKLLGEGPERERHQDLLRRVDSGQFLSWAGAQKHWVGDP